MRNRSKGCTSAFVNLGQHLEKQLGLVYGILQGMMAELPVA
jgi:hypothetical protein